MIKLESSGRNYGKTMKLINELIDKNNLLKKQNEWLIEKLSDRAAKQVGMPKELMEMTIRTELENVE